MKKLYILAVISALAVITTEGLCSTVLISVELSDIESKKAWHQLGIPTFELIENTAIAQADESQISLLRQRGYNINIIDQQPDLAKYKVVSKRNGMPEIGGKVLYENENAVIVKSDLKEYSMPREYKHQVHPLNIRPLEDRFWECFNIMAAPVIKLDIDPIIQTMVNQINQDSIASYILRLQNFQTRHVLTDSSYAASEWIRQKFNTFGFLAEFDSLYMTSNDTLLINTEGYERNVIAKIEGTNNPEDVLIVCAHFDAMCHADETPYIAPGADDNASGTAAIIEIARVLDKTICGKTVIFIAFTGEETSISGSRHYASTADSMGMNIIGVINLDMIGYTADTTYACHLVTFVDSASSWMNPIFKYVNENYITGLQLDDIYHGDIGDAYAFTEKGYQSISMIERDFQIYPYYHDPQDLLDKLDYNMFTLTTKNAISALCYMLLSPKVVDSVSVNECGIDSALVVSWKTNPEPNIAGYKVFWESDSFSYMDSSIVVSNVDTIVGLLPDTIYHFSVFALNSSSYQSPYAHVTTGKIARSPEKVTGLKALPVEQGISLGWNMNLESDIAGYRLYRRINDEYYDSLNIELLTDTAYTDDSLGGENKYYYWVRAFDIENYHGPISDSVYGRPITLDQGTLIVDGSYNWTASSYPRDVQQDSFYDYILSDYKHDQYDYSDSSKKPVFADLTPYSSILWHGDDYNNFLSYLTTNEIKSYLQCGGKLWFVGWKPTGDLLGSMIYPVDFNSGNLIYDYFKIAHVELSGNSDSFRVALGLKGYPDIMVDTLKYPVTVYNKSFRYVEALTPNASGDTIYVMDMKNDGSSYEGRACAVRDSGKTVFFGFPLYFMDKEQVKLAAQKVMAEFGEPSGVSGKPETENRITEVRLSQNAPNPFSNKTTIRYQLPQTGKVKLSVYNIAGQLVKTLVSEELPAGSYTVNWDRKDNNNKQVSAGVYIYHLSTSDNTQSRKMIVLK